MPVLDGIEATLRIAARYPDTAVLVLTTYDFDEFAARASRGLRGLPPISQREQEVLIGVARGLSNSELATRLFIGEATIKSHVSSLLTKLGCRDRVQLVVAAYEAWSRPAGPRTVDRNSTIVPFLVG